MFKAILTLTILYNSKKHSPTAINETGEVE
jgi:hypothetical protein